MIYSLWDVTELPLNQFGLGTGVSLNPCGFLPVLREVVWGGMGGLQRHFLDKESFMDKRQEGKCREGVTRPWTPWQWGGMRWERNPRAEGSNLVVAKVGEEFHPCGRGI